MARTKLDLGIERLVKQSRAAGGKRAEGVIRDGLRVRVTASGEAPPRILFWWRAPALGPDGKRAYIELGEHPAVSIEEAMTKLAAERAKHQRLRAGLAPVPEAPRPAADLTLSKLIERYVDVLARRLRDAEVDRGLLTRNLVNRLGDMPAAFMTAADAKEVIRQIRDEGKHSTASKVLQRAKAMFAWAARENLVSENPFRDLTASAFDLDTTPARREALTPDELGAIWRLLHEPVRREQARSEASRLGLLVLLATARRQGELVKSKKEWFDLDAGIWRVPPEARKMTKKAEAKEPNDIVSLPRQAVAALRRLFALQPSSPWALGTPLDSATGHVERKTLERTFRELQKSGALKLRSPASPHKFRHAFRSTVVHERWASGLVAELCLGHKLSGQVGRVVATYDLATYDEPRKKALQRWADYLDALAGLGEAGVVDLEAHRA